MILENEKKKEKEYKYHIFEHRHGAEGSSSSGARDSSSHNIRNFQHEMLVKGYHLPLNLTAHIGVSAQCGVDGTCLCDNRVNHSELVFFPHPCRYVLQDPDMCEDPDDYYGSHPTLFSYVGVAL